MLQQTLKFERYAASHKNPQGPGDTRPSALNILEDEGLVGKLSDKVVLITGGSSGIGVETVRALAHTGAKVVVGVRNLVKGQKVLDDLAKDSSKGVSKDQCELLEMDLSSLASIHNAAETFLSKHTQLNILIMNAGIGGVSEGKTVDGHELHFGTNHLSHFLLFQLLTPVLLASSTPSWNSRVIVVSSLIHRFAPVNLDDPDFKSTPYDPAMAYASSKCANIWFANHVERLYGSQGLHAISLHPGGIQTGLQDHHDPEYAALMQSTFEQFPELGKTMKSMKQGAATTVLAAVGRDFEGKGGIYLDDCAVAPEWVEGRDGIDAPGYRSWAFDEEGERRLWKVSEGMVEKPTNMSVI